MTSWLAWLEQTAASIWMREEANAYFYALIFHAWGMALLVGGGVVVCLLVLGRGRVLALHRLRPFVVVMGLGGALAVASGLGLLLGYPAKALTNPVFALKLACLALAVWAMRWLSRHSLAAAAAGLPQPPQARRVAALALLAWWGVVAGGKLLLYTYAVLMVS